MQVTTVATREKWGVGIRSTTLLLALICLVVVAALPVQAAPASKVPPAGSIVFGRLYRPASETFKYPQNAFRIGRTFGWLAHLRRAVRANRLEVTIDVMAGSVIKRHLGPVQAAPGDRALVSIIHSGLPGPAAVREGLSQPGLYVLEYSVAGDALATGTFRLTR